VCRSPVPMYRQSKGVVSATKNGKEVKAEQKHGQWYARQHVILHWTSISGAVLSERRQACIQVQEDI
jgi:hypothetical protein